MAKTIESYFDFVKVTLQDSVGAHVYTFSQPQLKQALAAAENLRTLIFNIQASDYVAAANNFNPDALDTTPRDSLPNLMLRMGTRLNPFTEYRIHGFSLAQIPIKGQPKPLMSFYVAVPRAPEPDHHLEVVINPAMSDTKHFLYGFNLRD
ncbi:MAG: hypothetical protein EOO57_13595 [Hymenobacter sp.]|nr:MAG: hypothetical protein EOO57_13595 [Hymenobacter sp.]